MNNDRIETNDTNMIHTTFSLYKWPRDTDIFNGVPETISKIPDDRVRFDVINFLMMLQDAIISYKSKIDNITYLPSLSLTNIDDGSTLIEWIFKDYRIGFSIELEHDRSSWYLVTNSNLGEVNKSGLLYQKDPKEIINDIFHYVIKNT